MGKCQKEEYIFYSIVDHQDIDSHNDREIQIKME